MPSIFPGMDPYLEDPAFWSDFHDSFIVYWSGALNDCLPECYEARINGRTRVIEFDTGTQPSQKADVAIHRAEGHGESEPVSERGAVPVGPVTVRNRLLDEERETFIEIRKLPERSVVAVLELLSPSDKTGGGRRFYLNKRNALLHQDVHIVELDLLLNGERIPFEDPLPRGDYFMFVTHAERRAECDVYRWSLRSRLPTLPIPLKAPDEAVTCDFAAVFTTTYDRGRYARSIDYTKQPPVLLSEADRAWVAELLRAK